MNQFNQYHISISIVFGFALVAGAIFFGNINQTVTVVNNDAPGNQAVQPAQPEANTDSVNPVTEADHIKGRVDAPIKIITYTDFECPFCQRFHNTMNQVMDNQDETGDVAWVFRQFPIEQLHSKAPAIALASECVAKLAGKEAFWQFADRYFEISPSNNRTDIETVIPQLVSEIGINKDEFTSCIEAGDLMADVEEDLNNAIATGGRGTPWSILVAPNGTTFPVSGAQAQAAIEQLITIARSEI